MGDRAPTPERTDLEFVYERRVAAEVIGPGAPGYLKVRLGARVRDVDPAGLPPALRMPNARFVAIVRGGEFVCVDHWKAEPGSRCSSRFVAS